jgi:hypothetical protein
MLPPPTLDAREAAVVDTAWREAEEEAPRPPVQAGGLFLAVSGMVLLTLVPAAGRVVTLDPGTAGGVLALAILLLLAGAGIAMGGGHLHRRADRRRVTAMVARLRTPPDHHAGLREATHLLARADPRGGPEPLPGASLSRLTAELGPALPTVLRVERYLVERGRMQPLFLAPGAIDE